MTRLTFILLLAVVTVINAGAADSGTNIVNYPRVSSLSTNSFFVATDQNRTTNKTVSILASNYVTQAQMSVATNALGGVMATDAEVAAAIAAHAALSDTLAELEAIFGVNLLTSTEGDAAYSPLTIDASGFNGNLTTSDNTLQEVAQALDDLTGVGGSFDGLTLDYNELAVSPTSTLELSWNTNMNSATLTEAVTVTFTDTPASGKSASIYLMAHGDFNVGADVTWTGNTNRVTSSTINLYEFSRVNGTNYGALLTRQVSTNEVQSYSTLLTDFAALQTYAQNLSFNNLDGTATIEQIPYADDGEIDAEKVVRSDDSRLNANPFTILGYDTTTNDTVKEFSGWSLAIGTNEVIHAKAEVFFGGTTNTDRGGFTIVGEASRTGTGALTVHTGTTNISRIGTTTDRDAYFDANGNTFVLKLKGPAGTTANWGVDGRYRTITNGMDTVAASSNTLTNGLVAYWKMDEVADGTTPVDRTDSWVNGITLVDTAAATDDNPGKLGNAAEFETGESNTMAVATDHASLDFTSSFSVSLWARKETASVLEYLVSKWNTGSQRSWNINCSAANVFGFAMSTDGGNTAVVTASATTFGSVTINTYYHIVATFDDTANEMKIYVNGTPDTATQTGTPFNSTQPVKVSGHTTTSSLFDGRIDEVAIWNRAITSAEVAELYNSGTGYEIPLN
jgi:hypothetical protein